MVFYFQPSVAFLVSLFFQLVEYLLQKGADANIAGVVGDHALHLACRRGFLNIVQLLIPETNASSLEADGNTKCWCIAVELCSGCWDNSRIVQ